MGEVARRKFSAAALRQIKHITASLGPLGAFEHPGTSKAPDTRPGQDAAHRSVGQSGETGTRTPPPPPHAKHKKGKKKPGHRESASRNPGESKDALPQKRGKPFSDSHSLVKFSLR